MRRITLLVFLVFLGGLPEQCNSSISELLKNNEFARQTLEPLPLRVLPFLGVLPLAAKAHIKIVIKTIRMWALTDLSR